MMAGLEESFSLRHGKVQNEFRELIQISRGSYGDVYRAERVQDGLEVCLKVVDLDLLSPQERLGCLSEVHLLRSLPAHPNVVACYDAFWEHTTDCGGNAQLVIVLEYGDSGDLESFIRAENGHNGLSAEIILPIFAQIVSGLEYLHRHRIIHRDIKSKNVFRFNDGRVVIGDLGTSKSLADTDTLASTLVGSPLYMSPEQLESRPYSFSSDVWSLGCLLYELFAGKTPFSAASYPAVVMNITRGAYEPLPASTPTQMEKLVTRMLVHDPSARPTVKDILAVEVLQRYIQNPALGWEGINERDAGGTHNFQNNPGLSRIGDVPKVNPLNNTDQGHPLVPPPPPIHIRVLPSSADDSKTELPPPPDKATKSKPRPGVSVANILSRERVGIHRRRPTGVTGTKFLSCVPVMDTSNKEEPLRLPEKQPPHRSAKPQERAIRSPIPQDNLLIIGTKISQVHQTVGKAQRECTSQKSH